MESLKDINGKESSKRKYGARLLNIGLAMGAIFFLTGLIMNVLGKVFDYEFPIDIFWTFVGSGSSLLGLGLVERFGKK